MEAYYFISTKKSLLDKKKIFHLLKECCWSRNIPIEYVERFVKYSLCFGVYKKSSNELVGFGRVISDYTTYAYICDVIIEKEHRQKNLGNRLIKKILAHPRLQGLKTWSLIATDQAKNIYKKNGFKIISCPENALEINDLDIYSYPEFQNLYKDEMIRIN